MFFKKIVIVFATIITMFSILLTSCAKAPTVTTLPDAEVRNYQGQDLSLITDEPDNSIKGPQYIDINTYRLQVTGLVQNSGNYTYEQVINGFPNYKKVVGLNCVEGWSVNILWEGVQVRDILAKAVPLTAAKVVIFQCYDGYTTSFPIEYIMNNPILMAYKVNDITLPPKNGFPFQLVAEMKWGYKWAKWITGIELSDNINYRGYWEERGYSNNGSLSGGFFDY